MRIVLQARGLSPLWELSRAMRPRCDDLGRLMRLILITSASLFAAACTLQGGGSGFSSCYAGSCGSFGSSYSAGGSSWVSAPRSQGYSAPRTVYTSSTPSSSVYGSNVGYRTVSAPRLRGPFALRPASFYGSVGGILYDIDDSAVGVQARVGYDSGNIFGAEIEGSFGVSDDDSVNGAVTTENDIDYSVAGFAIGRVPVARGLSAHARIGYHETEVSRTTTMGGMTTEADLNFDGLAYGGGFEWDISPIDAIRADYTRYENTGGVVDDSISLAWMRRF